MLSTYLKVEVEPRILTVAFLYLYDGLTHVMLNKVHSGFLYTVSQNLQANEAMINGLIKIIMQTERPLTMATLVMDVL